MKWSVDPKTNQPSVTLTLLVSGFAVCLVKLLLGDVNLFGLIRLSAFSGGDFAMAVGSLGALYAARKHSDNVTK